MSDPVFTPAKAPAGAVAPANAQLVYLREVLFAIKGIYHHPLTEADAPLPPHRWALVEPGETLYVEGTTSDTNGVSTLLRPETPKGSADADWDLWLIPMFEDKASSSEVVDMGEVWIDVDKNQWVRPKEVDTALTQTRRLLRIPRWTSFRHAVAFDGKFRELPPGVTDFDKRGRIKQSELTPHGTLDKPWTIAIDEGWMRTFVQFRFYDPTQKKERAAPKGLVVEALGVGKDSDGVELGPMRVGASSVTRDDGSIYIVHSRAEAKATDLDYQFATPEHTTFAYADGKFESKKLTDFARLEKEYPVAPLWHSFGHEAWEGAVDSTPAARKAFSAIRAKGTTAQSPISFHLDDMVLTSLTAPQTVPANQRRMGLYTALAGLHDPSQSNGKDAPYSTLQASAILHAEEAMFRRGKGFDQLTRFIDWEGDLYDVSTKFASGIVGTTAGIGSRAADLATPIEDNAAGTTTGDVTSGHRTYLFDTRWIHHSHDGVDARLAHLVCYVSVFIDGSQLHPLNANAVGVIENLLVDASKRWDQKHPGISDSTSLKKDYVIIPEKGFKTDSTLMKVRHVFGRRSLIQLTGTLPKPIVIQVDTQPGRATGGRTMRLYCQRGSTIAPPPNPAWLSATPPGPIPARPYTEFEPTGTGTAERLDNSTFPRFTLAHELGHESGLLDEYLEGIDGRTLVGATANDFVPRFDQFGIRARPYYLDSHGMMQTNQLPRLRYIWNYFDALHRNTTNAPAWFFAEAPFVAQYKASSRTLTHAIPRSSASWLSARGGPWTAATGTQGDCNLSFYPTSHDEGMIGPAVVDSGFIPSGKEFDGILVVHPMIWVSFAASVTGNNAAKWAKFAPWASLYYTQATTVHFAIETPSAPDAKRVLIVFQPRFEFAPTPTIRSAGPPQVLETIASATLELRVTKGGPGAAYAAGTPPVLSVDENWISGWIIRYALQTKPTVQPVADKLPTTAAHLSMLPAALATLLGRPEIGTVVAYKKGP